IRSVGLRFDGILGHAPTTLFKGGGDEIRRRLLQQKHRRVGERNGSAARHFPEITWGMHLLAARYWYFSCREGRNFPEIFEIMRRFGSYFFSMSIDRRTLAMIVLRHATIVV